MTFSSEVKKEISRSTPEKRCCMTAELAGLLRSAGYITPAGAGRFGVFLVTAYPFVAHYMKRLIAEATGENPSVYTMASPSRYTKNRYEVRLEPSDAVAELLREVGIVSQTDGLTRIETAISPALTATKCCRKRLVAGFFIGSGVVTDPEKGYGFEISVKDRALAGELRRVIATFTGVRVQVRERGEKAVVYVKRAEQVRDMLGIIGAHAALLRFEEARMIKELRGQANRLSNLDGANIGRMVASAEKQITAAQQLLESKDAQTLPQPLTATAKLRLSHPEASLSELAKLADPPVTKSTIHKRLKAIEEAAKNL
jgi:DNA-binding protein WhiA